MGNLAFAQGCCTSGSSTFGGFERGVAEENILNVGISYIRNSLNSTYNGRNEIDDPLERIASVSIINIEMEYGISDRISLLAIAGYSVKERETIVRSSVDNSIETINFKGSGINDLVVLSKYELIKPSIISPLSLSIGGGMKLPLGSYRQEDNGTRLSIDLQPGTGATDVLLWGSFYKGFQELSFSIFTNLLYRYTGANLDSYRFGDEYIISLNGEYYLTDYLTLALGLRARFANEDFWRDRFLPSTGGTYYDLLPSIIYGESNYLLKIFYQSPVYRNVRGIQLTTSSIFGAEILFKVDI
jgi:hypothetical protein